MLCILSIAARMCSLRSLVQSFAARVGSIAWSAARCHIQLEIFIFAHSYRNVIDRKNTIVICYVLMVDHPKYIHAQSLTLMISNKSFKARPKLKSCSLSSLN